MRVFDEEVSKSKILGGNYETMLKFRAKKLPEIKESIQDLFKDYDGGSVAIVIMKEDENGMPSGRHLFMAGVSRPEVQFMLGKALNDASEEAIDCIMEEAKKSPEHLIAVTKMMAEMLEQLTNGRE